ncbi:serine/threonine-protein phosphatase 7 long form homolog [Mercurialis annua]|uniref:serine/threonine-protein phosphatase 7 long form homolog n=1 Tax=Mercurialis annua TaxID=3986 RepID=UPI00215E36A9|nr:serine/threonine-protein phosphatase 7 long form homolog [Mercurialis annua]
MFLCDIISFCTCLWIMAAPHDYYSPGPHVPDVLHMQDDHRSSVIWDNQDDNIALGSRSSAGLSAFDTIDHRIRAGIIQTGLSGFIEMRQLPVDMSLVTALVERWRPETHTFMFPEGECTITLQDVAILTGLPIDGLAVTGPRIVDWNTIAVPLLGRALQASHSPGSSWVGTGWLYAEFAQFLYLPEHATEVEIGWAVRAYLWAALQGLCFTDLNSGHLGLRILPQLADLGGLRDISWGSAVLAHLYHELCIASMTSQHRINIGGATWILQLWAFERLTPLRPRLIDAHIAPHLPLGDRWAGPRDRRRVPRHDLRSIRVLLDGLRYEDIEWQPYSDVIVRSIPQQYLAGARLWRARVPLIYYHIVEWHQSDRVLQQFGLIQPIPLPAMQDHRLHNIRYRGCNNFLELLLYYVMIWNNRESFVVEGHQLQRPPHYHSQYMEWYRSRSRRWITHQGAETGSSRDTMEMIRLQAEAGSRIRTAARSLQLASREERRDVTLPAPEPTVPPFILPDIPPATIDLDAIQGRRRQRPRAREQPRPRPADPIPPPVYFHVDVAETWDRHREYYRPTQYCGTTSEAPSQSLSPQTSPSQGPRASSFQVSPTSMPFFNSSYGKMAYTTPLATPPHFSQPTSPTQSDQYQRPPPPTFPAQSDQYYYPSSPRFDQPSTSHERPSSSP